MRFTISASEIRRGKLSQRIHGMISTIHILDPEVRIDKCTISLAHPGDLAQASCEKLTNQEYSNPLICQDMSEFVTNSFL